VVATGEAAPVAVVGTATADVDDVVVFVGAEDERSLEHGGGIVDFEFMPTFATIGGSIVGCFAGQNEGLELTPVKAMGYTVFLSKGCSVSCSALSAGTPLIGVQVTPSSSER